MNAILTLSHTKLSRNRIRSAKERVANLSELTESPISITDISNQLQKSLQKFCSSHPAKEIFSTALLQKINHLKNVKYNSLLWNMEGIEP